MSTTLGRLSTAEVGKPVILDEPSKVVKALLSNQDAMIDLIVVLCTKLDADGGVTDTNYNALVGALLTKVNITL